MKGFPDRAFNTLPPGYRGWAMPGQRDPASVWVWLAPEEREGLSYEQAGRKAESDLSDDRIFHAPHRACAAAWAHYDNKKQPAASGADQIIAYARDAKAFIKQASDDSIADPLLMRAAVAFNMLAMRGMIRGPLNVLDRSHAIALLASGFADDPPSTPERAALFTTTLDEEVVR